MKEPIYVETTITVEITIPVSGFVHEDGQIDDIAIPTKLPLEDFITIDDLLNDNDSFSVFAALRDQAESDNIANLEDRD